MLLSLNAAVQTFNIRKPTKAVSRLTVAVARAVGRYLELLFSYVEFCTVKFSKLTFFFISETPNRSQVTIPLLFFFLFFFFFFFPRLAKKKRWRKEKKN